MIVVSLEDRKLALVEDGQVKKVYTVAVGKPSTPSPVGTFTIARRAANPTYHHNGKTVLPGPGNPVGTRWMGLSIPGYGIHGTNEPNSIGKAASHGCIRMARADLEEFYELVAVGDTVELVGERNEETAQLFGDRRESAATRSSPPDGNCSRTIPDRRPCGFALRRRAMNLLMEAMNGLGAVLLPVAAGLLFEELTLEGWSGCCSLHGREPENELSAITSKIPKKEKDNDRIEAVIDDCGSALAGCRCSDSTL